jgi:hypothetical protein
MARLSYVAAVRQLDQALRAFDESDIPMDPGDLRTPPPWTTEHYALITTVADRFHQVVELRHRWDGMRTGYREPH